MGAGRAWWRGGLLSQRGRGTLLDEAERLGISADQLGEDPAFAIWSIHRPAIEAFMEVASQMRRVVFPNGTVSLEGLDYAGARAGLELAGIEITPELWGELRTIEAGAVEASRS